MARSVTSDFLHNMRFHVEMIGADLLGSALDGTTHKAEAGFKTCSLPDMSVDVKNYKEGIWVYDKKFPGVPTVGDVTMSRGVTRGDTAFYKWLLTAAEGTGTYRADLKIYVYHRDTVLTLRATDNTDEKIDRGLTSLSSNVARTITLYEAFPTKVTMGSALDSANAEISIAEITLTCERFSVDDGTANPAPSTVTT